MAAGIIGGTIILVGATVAIGYEQIFGTGGAAGLFTDGRARNVGDFAAIAWQHFPLGSGLGSFDPVYRVSETVVSIQLNYLNNAHNEPAQILIEAGIGGAMLMLLFVIWLAQSGWAAIWKPDLDARNARQVRAALLILAMLTLHSLVDYPLRTMALSAIFALCVGIVVVRPTVVTGRARGLALNAWIDTHTHPDFIFPSEARGHMTFA